MQNPIRLPLRPKDQSEGRSGQQRISPPFDASALLLAVAGNRDSAIAWFSDLPAERADEVQPRV